MKYDIGDIVKVREDLIAGDIYEMESGESDVFEEDMAKYRGQVYEITESNSIHYRLNGCEYWNFTDEMLEDSMLEPTTINEFKINISSYNISKNNVAVSVFSDTEHIIIVDEIDYNDLDDLISVLQEIKSRIKE